MAAADTVHLEFISVHVTCRPLVSIPLHACVAIAFIIVYHRPVSLYIYVTCRPLTQYTSIRIAVHSIITRLLVSM